MPDSSLSPFSLPLSGLVGFLLTAACFPFYIRWLKDRQLGQFIREEGPASHAAKAKTPTMGGLCFMCCTLLTVAIWWLVAGGADLKSIVVVAAALVCGLIGLVDDLAKLRRKANAGLSGRLRLALETVIGLALGWLLLFAGVHMAVLVPGLAWLGAASSWLALPAALYFVSAAFFVAATTNAVNLHDGMDGLAAGTSIQVLACLAFVLLAAGQVALAAVAASAAGSVAAFLIFNRHPAQIFMGDTGSLFIGGLMAALVVAGRIELWFIPLALIYIVETLSVMIQVVYFKLTKDYQPDKPMSPLALAWLKLTRRLPGEGRRFFRMSPLHHHFEAVAADKGIGEAQVVTGFWLVQLVLCIAVLALLKP